MRPIMVEECKKVEESLETYPELKRHINDTTRKEFFSQKKRLKQHPLFFYLLRNGNAKKLEENLKLLEGKCDKFNTVLKKLHERDYKVFHSYVSEIDVLSYYYSKSSDDFQIEYEPGVKEKDSKIDAKITINGKDYFLEIFTVFPDKNFITKDDITLQIRLKLDALEKNPYIICLTIFENFRESDIDSFCQDVGMIIDEILSKEEGAEKNIEVINRAISKNNNPIGEVRLCRGKNKKGFVGSVITPFQEVKDASRIKNKILTKIDEQLPSNDRNIVVINLSKIMGGGFYDVDDAVLGQKTVIVDKKTLKGKDGRHQNGVVHHEKGKHISLIIPYINDDFGTRIFFINDLTASEVITKEEANKF